MNVVKIILIRVGQKSPTFFLLLIVFFYKFSENDVKVFDDEISVFRFEIKEEKIV